MHVSAREAGNRERGQEPAVRPRLVRRIYLLRLPSSEEERVGELVVLQSRALSRTRARCFVV